MRDGSIAEFLAGVLSCLFLAIMIPTSLISGFCVTVMVGDIIRHNTPCEIKK
jgi:hypothetical protein